jgi:hypothetical protein
VHARDTGTRDPPRGLRSQGCMVIPPGPGVVSISALKGPVRVWPHWSRADGTNRQPSGLVLVTERQNARDVSARTRPRCIDREGGPPTSPTQTRLRCPGGGHRGPGIAPGRAPEVFGPGARTRSTSIFAVPPAGLEPAAYRLGDRARSSRGVCSSPLSWLPSTRSFTGCRSVHGIRCSIAPELAPDSRRGAGSPRNVEATVCKSGNPSEQRLWSSGIGQDGPLPSMRLDAMYTRWRIPALWS